MLDVIRRRVSATTLVAVLALVFAITGGAYAASRYVVTSTKQISPKVLKALKGSAGASGKTGANGTPGPTGGAGSQGAQGPAGPAGGKGETGAAGAPGKEGALGKEGSPWAAGGTLPTGRTETGAWSIQTNSEEDLSPTFVSFPIPLAEGLSNEHVFFIEPGQEGVQHPVECPGSVANPEAATGDLCVYTKLFAGELKPFTTPIDEPSGTFSNPGAGVSGAILWFSPEAKEPIGAWGTWAVTAP